jgi:hypothetical protein
MRTTDTTRQARANLAPAPKSLTWLVYCRDNKLLTASEWALAAILVTLGAGQNITLSIKGMSDVTRMDRKTVRAAIESLTAKGLLVFVRPGANQTKVYRLTLPRWGNDTHPGEEMTPTQVRKSHPPGGEMTPTTSTEDQERDQHLHQHPDDGVGGATPGEDGPARAKVSAQPDSPGPVVPPVEDFIGDLEGCVDELTRRLGIDPGAVNIKALAKKWRETVIRHGENEGVSVYLDYFPADHPMWSTCASKDNPVGYLLFDFDKWLADTDPEPSKVPA